MGVSIHGTRAQRWDELGSRYLQGTEDGMTSPEIENQFSLVVGLRGMVLDP